MSHSAQALSQQRPISVFLVEDEEGDQELFRIALSETKARYTLNCVEDGIEAISYLNRGTGFESALRPDIIILDLNLPKKNGIEVLKYIKASIVFREIPVIVLSTSYDNTDIKSAYRHGASAYIIKPGNFHEFRSSIGRLKDYWFETVSLPEK